MENCSLNETYRFLVNDSTSIYLIWLSKKSFRITNKPLNENVIEAKGPFSLGNLLLRIGHNGEITLTEKDKVLLDGRLLINQVSHVLGNKAFKEDNAKDDNKEKVSGSFIFKNDRPIYGLGDKTGPLDKRGYSYINYNTDDPSAQVDTFRSLYKSINFFACFDKNSSIGFFLDNTSKTYYDFQKEDRHAIKLSYALGDFDLYVFVGSLLGVSSSFSKFVGTSVLPPRWALGYQQSRWSYPSKEAVEQVIKGYEKIGVPLTAIYLDIDYMDHYKDFTVNETKFPDFEKWVSSLLKKGIHIVPIIDAGLKAEKGYFMYDEGLKNGYLSTLDGEVYHNEVWPGDSVFPSFMDPKTMEWWSLHVKDFLLKYNVSGIWNDMNEPASFKGPLPPNVDIGGLPHELAHNIYAENMNIATNKGFILANKRPFIVTRAAYARTAHFACSWTGDNQSIWDHLRLDIPQLCNLCFSGFQMTGNDIGGFSGDTTKELLLRWVELGVFSPLMRNHSALNTLSQEGYAFDEETSKIYQENVLLRYQLISFLYDLLRESEVEGLPVYRSLIENFPNDERLINENTEAMLGDILLFAPALFPGQKSREVYLPATFYDFYTGKKYRKGDHLIKAPLNRIPLFMKDGSLLPLVKQSQPSTDYPEELLFVYAGSKARYLHYEDEGDGLGYKNGEYNLILALHDGKKNSVVYLHEGLKKRHYKKVSFVDIKKLSH